MRWRRREQRVNTARPRPTASDDARITTSIQSKYFLDDRIKGRHIDVTTNAGVVTLNGEVADETERAEALLLARTTEGVKRVEDNLTVTAGQPTAGDLDAASPTAAAPTAAGRRQQADETLTARVKSQLSSDTQVKNAPIEVTAKNGVVLLEGTVPTSAAKARALTLARGHGGRDAGRRSRSASEGKEIACSIIRGRRAARTGCPTWSGRRRSIASERNSKRCRVCA